MFSALLNCFGVKRKPLLLINVIFNSKTSYSILNCSITVLENAVNRELAKITTPADERGATALTKAKENMKEGQSIVAEHQ